MSETRRGAFVGLVMIAAAILARPALGQNLPTSAPVPVQAPAPLVTPVMVIDAASLDRLTKALGTPSKLVLKPQQPRFYSLTTLKLTSIKEDMKKWDLRITQTAAPTSPNSIRAAPSIDILGLIGALVRGERERELNELRARIDRELAALNGKR